MKKIVVIGEQCTDKFVYCEVNRLSPEAPVPILSPLRTVNNDGMAGNTIRNIKSMDKNCQVIAITPSKIPTKTRYIEDKTNHMFFRFDKGDDNIDKFEFQKFYYEFISDADIVVVSDYNKGYLSDKDLQQIAFYSKLSILDSKRKLNNDITEMFTFVKLNEEEAQNNKLLNKDNVIITLGAAGAMFKGMVYPSPKPQETIDVSGAGDTFTAAFAISYSNTQNIAESIIFANEMSAKVVSKRGVVTP
jgi:bifunctional ADP-heptose synthase (sugar kinase/adenylyltransferase)